MLAYELGGSEVLFWIVVVVTILAGLVLAKMLLR
jgi:hypothetical protein